MQLRTVKKPKSKAFDFGREGPSDQTPTRKTSFNKEQETGGQSSDIGGSHLNVTQENETKSRHKLRNTSTNYQGKYKKMNSGKYLYKSSNSEKKPILNKKKQLKTIPFELVNTFKRLLNKLNKKEEESVLNKKKKREESKDGTIGRPKNEMQENFGKKKMGNKLNGYHQINNFNSFDYQSYMMKSPYEVYYNQNLIESMKNHQGFPGENQPYYFNRMNKDFVRMFGMPGPDLYYKQGYPPGFEGEPKAKPDSIFNLINDKENLNRINKIANEGVNHIVAAFFIKSVQNSRSTKTEPNLNLPRRSSVPVNAVNFNEEAPSNEPKESHPYPPIKTKENNDPQTNTEIVKNSSPELKNSSNVLTMRHSSSPKAKANDNSKFLNLNLNTSIFNDKYSSDINEFTTNQLNTVNDVVKKLKENKISELIDKELMNTNVQFKN